MIKLLVGCDPEIFLRNPNTGKMVSAEGKLPGDKRHPHPVKGGSIQVDGFAAEIGITPASSATQFADNVESVLGELRGFVPGYELCFIDSTVFDDDVFLAQSDKGRQLGCEPDFNAYTELQNNHPVPNPPSFRTAAGHVHLGWGEGLQGFAHFQDCLSVVKQLDLYVGFPTTLLTPDSKRRALYGKAGAFREKSYGVEYRTPDNGWLRSRDSMMMVFNNTLKGFNRICDGHNDYRDVATQPGIDLNKIGYISDVVRGLSIQTIRPEKKAA